MVNCITLQIYFYKNFFLNHKHFSILYVTFCQWSFVHYSLCDWGFVWVGFIRVEFFQWSYVLDSTLSVQSQFV